MALSPGTKLGVYEIVDALGVGGMGEVYRARDTKLGREVAIKILPEALALDPERVARFEREAKALAALNHPHIAALFGLEAFPNPESPIPNHVLVMELVEGETLAERIARGPLPLEGALTLALQIAEALEAAHEKGIVHRDLKPANVKITPDDKVKVLDFGLAKAMEPAGSSGPSGSGGPGGFTHSPTLSMMATQAGVILGTAAYMSPEQAKGFPADQRSDIFSFGVVLYEMLTGRQPFHGETAPEILASVLIRDADLNTLPANLNPRLLDLLKRCLQKNPKQRWQHIGDVRAELETIAADPRGRSSTMATAAPPRPLWRRAIPVVATALVAGAISATVAWMLKPSAPRPVVTRFSIALPDDQQFTNTGRQLLAISHDGTQVVYVANQRLYLRSMWDKEARPIAGIDTVGAVLNPVFSPDGFSIAFFATVDSTIKRIASAGGAPVTICQATAPFGMSWTGDDILIGQASIGIVRVPASGGKPEVIVKTNAGEVAHGPELLPGGDTVLFTLAKESGSVDRWDKAQVVAQSLKTGARMTVIDGGSDARYLSTGHLVYALGGVLFAVPFDPTRPSVRRGPVPIVEGVRRAIASGTAQFSVSDGGALVYLPGPSSLSSGQSDLALVDRKGAVEPLKLRAGAYDLVRASPDGKQVAFSSDDGTEAIVWIYELSGASSMRRLTIGGHNRFPIWSPDGRRVAFQSDRDGDLAIFWQQADGTGTAERLTTPESGTGHVPESWSPDGKHLLFAVRKTGATSLYFYSFEDKKTAPFANVQSVNLTSATFSPDGQWVAYSSNATPDRSYRIYVQPFPATGTKYEIGTGIHPIWSPDGKELMFGPGQGRFGAVSVTTRPTFTFGNLVKVQRTFIEPGPQVQRPYDIMPNGKLVGIVVSGAAASGAATTSQLQVVLNWFEDLKQRVLVK